MSETLHLKYFLAKTTNKELLAAAESQNSFKKGHGYIGKTVTDEIYETYMKGLGGSMFSAYDIVTSEIAERIVEKTWI